MNYTYIIKTFIILYNTLSYTPFVLFSYNIYKSYFCIIWLGHKHFLSFGFVFLYMFEGKWFRLARMA